MQPATCTFTNTDLCANYCAHPSVMNTVDRRVCAICRQNTTSGKWPARETLTPVQVVSACGVPVDPAVLGAIQRQQSGCKGCGDAPMDGI